MREKVLLGRDARGRALHIDDHVIDDRGRVYVVDETERTFQQNRIVRVLPLRHGILGSHTYVRCLMVFRVRQPGTEAENRALYRRLWGEYATPRVVNEIAAMRQRVAAAKEMPMRSCPVCLNGHAPVRFKIGVAVWEGRKLRMCSTGCARRITREVHQLINENPGYDKERLRRRVAWRYIQQGG